MRFAKDSIAEVFLFLNLCLWGSFLGHTEIFFFFKAGICSNWLQPFLQFVVGTLCRVTSDSWWWHSGDISHSHCYSQVSSGSHRCCFDLKKKQTLCITPVNHSLLFIHQQLKDVDKGYSGVVQCLGLTEPLKNNLIPRVILEDSVH